MHIVTLDDDSSGSLLTIRMQSDAFESSGRAGSIAKINMASDVDKVRGKKGKKFLLVDLHVFSFEINKKRKEGIEGGEERRRVGSQRWRIWQKVAAVSIE